MTVTAERRTENIRDVPNSVSTVSGEDLDVLSTGGQQDVVVRRLDSTSNALVRLHLPRFYIRGYGNGDFRRRVAARLAYLR